MRLDELPKSARIEDRRGSPVARGGIGIGTIVVLAVIGWALGIDPRTLIGGAEMLSRGGNQPQQADAGSTTSSGDPSDATGQFVSAVLGSTETVWTDIFAQAGKTYKPPTWLCFPAQRGPAVGLRKPRWGRSIVRSIKRSISIQVSFRTSNGAFAPARSAATCQFSQAYVIAHEIGHHVQNLLGLLPKVQEAKRAMDKAEANSLQVRVELQADCLAGVWANRGHAKWEFIEPGDVDSALQTASAIGDDRLQRQTQGYVVPDAFNHGTSAQRSRWFMTGLRLAMLAAAIPFALSSCSTSSTRSQGTKEQGVGSVL